ncbi:MAG: hypothetical protein ACK5NQ_11640 [Pseudomonas sp.]
MEKVFYVPGQPWAIDFAVERDGVTVSQISGETLEQVQARHPGAIVADYAEVCAQVEAQSKTEPRQIDAEDFDYALNVLPPVGWVRESGCESFKMSEHTNGNVTAIYARLGDTFWTFQDVYTMKHAEIMEKVREAQASPQIRWVG